MNVHQKRVFSNWHQIPLTIICAALVTSGCGGTKNRTRKVPEAPQYEAIKAACLDHKKSKDNGEKQVPIEREAKALRMSVDLWENYEYARKELAKAAVTIEENRAVAGVELQVKEGEVQKAQAEADHYKGQRWWFAGVGVLVGVVAAVGVAMAFR